ncbi:nuclear nucleic acid-binding protein C1D-like [Portunus trituberculatus]|uniref:nuclear nucleic acid-binding protein C1D-like n=1 Tax=Portunus trituberculatus TaxID=210409 RepID=UPI001E1D0246|nr:nuclear nucleic acid-binding protein C1D-like [Portunus trituberculatus]
MDEDVGKEVQQKSDEFPPGMAPKMLSLLKSVTTLEQDLKPLLAQPYHEAFSKLSPLERAKVGMMEIYTINSLFWVLMKASGEEMDETLRDDYKVEMGRLRDTQGRLSEVEAREQRPATDARVAARFIRQGLGIKEEDCAEEPS